MLFLLSLQEMVLSGKSYLEIIQKSLTGMNLNHYKKDQFLGFSMIHLVDLKIHLFSGRTLIIEQWSVSLDPNLNQTT